MVEKSKLRGRIPAGELKAVKRWALPDIETTSTRETSLVSRRRPEESAPAVGEVHDEEIEARPPTLKELERIRHQAFEEGFREGREAGHQEGHAAGMTEGFQQGHAEGVARGEQEIRAQIGRLVSLVEQLSQPLADQERELEQVLLQLVRTLGEAAVGAELRQHPEHLEAALKRALAALPEGSDPLTVELHPGEVAQIRRVAEAQGETWRILADASLTPGSLRLQRGPSYLAYDLKARFQEACAQLLDDRGAAEPPADE